VNHISHPALLRAEGLSRTFGGRRALDDVSITVEPGSIHAILGKNGAGKSTLMKLVAGSDRPDRGTIWLGEGTLHGGVTAHQAAGISYVPQELTMFPGMTVTDQVLLNGGYPRSPTGAIRRRRGEQAVARTLSRLDPSIDAAASVEDLTLPQLRMVMIARALHKDARVLILDEPTEAFTASDVDVLFGVLRSVAAAGTSILYVSHRLSEVFSLADTCTVLRDGRMAMANLAFEPTMANEVVSAIVNEPMHRIVSQPSRPVEPRPPEELSENAALTFSAREGAAPLHVMPGEVVGLVGHAGSGRTSIMERIAQLAPIAGGSTHFAPGHESPGLRKTGRRPRVIFLPEDRARHAILPHLTVAENVSIADLQRVSIRGGPFVSRREVRRRSNEALARVGLASDVLDLPVHQLSGGNQQKVLLARGIFADAQVWLLDEPTVGLDLRARRQVLSLVGEMARNSVAVTASDPKGEHRTTCALITSSDFDDLIGVCDAVYVVREGINHERLQAPFTEQQLVQLAST